MTIIIAAQTAAATHDMVVSSLPTTIITDGLAGVETVDIQISADGGTTYNTIYSITATEIAKVIDGFGEYRISKGVTAGAVSVASSTASGI